jgi:RNA polymerase sigma factor (sigma-70 family)
MNSTYANPQSNTPTQGPIEGLVARRKQFLRFVESRVETPATAEDIIQSAYLRAVQQISDLRDSESATAWFYRILRNAVIDHYRHRTVEDRTLEEWSTDLLPETAVDSPTEQAICACINSVLATMKPAYSQIIREVDLAERPLEAFAKTANITPGNAAVRAHRARQALRKQLILTCKACAKHACRNCNCAA